MRSSIPACARITWSGCTSLSFTPDCTSLPTKIETSRPEPVEKIAEAATPGVGATTPFKRSVEAPLALACDAVPPKSFAAVAMSADAPEEGAALAIAGGVAKIHVQCASCYATASTIPATMRVPNTVRTLDGDAQVDERTI